MLHFNLDPEAFFNEDDNLGDERKSIQAAASSVLAGEDDDAHLCARMRDGEAERSAKTCKL